MRSDYHSKHKSKENKKALDTFLHRWSKMSKVDKIINSFLGLVIIVLILSIGILIHSNSSPQYTKKSNNREMVSSASSKSSKKQDHQVDEEEINDDSNSASSTNEVEEAGSAISSNKNTDRKNHGEVSEGMNAEYRMAKQAGIIDDSESVQDFYNNVQDNIDDGGQGSFTYNGKTVYVEKTYQDNPNGIKSGGTIYGDPDRYTVTTDQ